MLLIIQGRLTSWEHPTPSWVASSSASLPSRILGSSLAIQLFTVKKLRGSSYQAGVGLVNIECGAACIQVTRGSL